MPTNDIEYEAANPDVIAQAVSNIPRDELLSQLADFYKVMGDPTRLKILMALEKSELCATDLALVLDMTRSATSHQLKLLKSAKLVKNRKEGKSVFYSLDDEHIHSVIKVALAHILE